MLGSKIASDIRDYWCFEEIAKKENPNTAITVSMEKMFSWWRQAAKHMFLAP